MASYTLGVGESTTPVDQKPWQLDGAFCPESGPAVDTEPCGLAATGGTSHWTRTGPTTTVRTFAYGCLAGHAWTVDVSGHCPDRPADTATGDTTEPAADAVRLAHA
ncbi:hypothetical protein [Streptodolium elevatio]|uniref:Uncharacterized protein n=1 Tax=Streptodolium elevatio TaxID=3157996 RepID=A0ABV3DTG6_9ACTN